MPVEPDLGDLQRSAGWLAASLERDHPGYVESEAAMAERAGEQRTAEALRWFFRAVYFDREVQSDG